MPKEDRAWPGFRAEAEEVWVLDLGVDQRPTPPLQPVGEGGKRHLGAAGFGAEHAFAEEHPSDRHAVDAADQSWPVEDFNTVRMAEPVQLDVGGAHRERDPGAAPTPSRGARA